MTESRMYDKRQGNIPVFRGCFYNCVYCSFKRLVQLNKKCPNCAEFKPHSHMEVLKRTPQKTRADEFVTVGLSSDVSFMKASEFYKVIEYCSNYPFTTFLIQSKSPVCFLPFQSLPNVIFGTTIETNYNELYFPDGDYLYYNEISLAPSPEWRYKAMMELTCRKVVTIEPIMNFDLEILTQWIKDIKPEIAYVGYCNDGHNGKRLKLPEPSWDKTQALLGELLAANINVVEKSLRKAWWEA